MNDMTQGLPVTEGRTLSGTVTLTADAVVIGSGAGGAVVACELARQGMDVVVLEAGPHVPSSQFGENFSQALERLYAGHGAQTNADGDLLLLQGRCLGGSTVVNGCVSFRTPDFVLDDWRREFGLDNLSPQTLAPYFERVERNLGIHENGEHEIAAHSRLAREGARRLGWSVRPFRRNIRDCALTGHCLSGCRTDRKQSMLVTYLPWAAAHGARLFSDVAVQRIVTGRDGRAAGVEAEALDAAGRPVARVSVRAPRVVLAAGAVQSPALLLRSGLANGSDQVGRNFACHPSLYVAAKYSQPVHPWRGAMLGVYIDEFLHPDKGGFILEAGGLGPLELSGVAEAGTGAAHLAFMRDARYHSGLVTLIHDHNVGRISLCDGAAHIDYRIADADHPSMKAALKAAARLHLAAGAEKVLVPTVQRLEIHREADIDPVVDGLPNAPHTLRLVSYHPQGSCRMGADPARAVVDPFGQTHEVGGLYVADASLFPTSIIVNPQQTVYALAHYVADHIVAAG